MIDIRRVPLDPYSAARLPACGPIRQRLACICAGASADPLDALHEVGIQIAEHAATVFEGYSCKSTAVLFREWVAAAKERDNATMAIALNCLTDKAAWRQVIPPQYHHSLGAVACLIHQCTVDAPYLGIDLACDSARKIFGDCEMLAITMPEFDAPVRKSVASAYDHLVKQTDSPNHR